MKRIPFRSLGLGILLTFSLAAQVKRPAVSDNPGASGRASVARATESLADPQTGRRAAIVVLSEPSLSETLVTSQPRIASLDGGQSRVNTERIRERMFSADGETRLATIRMKKQPLMD